MAMETLQGLCLHPYIDSFIHPIHILGIMLFALLILISLCEEQYTSDTHISFQGSNVYT